MSANDTDVETQVKRHRGPLFGFAGVLLFAGALLAGLMIWTFYQSENPAAESPAEVLSN